MKNPEMLGSVLQSCEGWTEVHAVFGPYWRAVQTSRTGLSGSSFEQKDFLLNRDARFDRKFGHWYIPNNVDSEPFKDMAKRQLFDSNILIPKQFID
ncbi:MAG: hypothetical protein HRT36_00675 [Alphaproteobacteria bacterium]|nr:hypothetical protein [Alphaproteobacteria bacterium]